MPLPVRSVSHACQHIKFKAVTPPIQGARVQSLSFPAIISTIMFSFLPTSLHAALWQIRAIVLIQPCQWLLQWRATDRAQLFCSHSIVHDALSRSRDNTSSISSCYLPHSAASPRILTSMVQRYDAAKCCLVAARHAALALMKLGRELRLGW